MKMNSFKNIDLLVDHLKNDWKFQVSIPTASLGALLVLMLEGDNKVKIFLIFLFLLPLCYFVLSLLEKIIVKIKEKKNRIQNWTSLTKEEEKFLSHYFRNQTKTRYVLCYNGTYKDSGIINPLIKKEILYLASTMAEYRGDSWMSMGHYFPINIHDDAYNFLLDKNKVNKKK